MNLEEAIKRDKELYNIQEKETKSWKRKYLISLVPYLLCLTKSINEVIIPAFSLSVFAGLEYRNNKKKLNELKKYREYLSIYKELEKEENKGIARTIEKDRNKPLNINTLDNFTYNDIKAIKKVLKRRNNNIESE